MAKSKTANIVTWILAFILKSYLATWVSLGVSAVLSAGFTLIGDRHHLPRANLWIIALGIALISFGTSLAFLRNTKFFEKRLPPVPQLSGSQSLEILDARWGEGDVQRDVTDLVQRNIKDGRLEMRVSNEAFGGDPAFGTPKYLRVKYRVNGSDKFKAFGEESDASLPRRDDVY